MARTTEPTSDGSGAAAGTDAAGGVDEQLLRTATPRVLGALLRRWRDLDRCEDAVQEAVVAALTRWPRAGVPADPAAWLVRVADRRVVDGLRREAARERRELLLGPLDEVADGVVEDPDGDLVALLQLCGHRALSRTGGVALALRAVAGLTTEQIARLHLVPTATAAQRISRAKAALRAAGARFAPLPPPGVPVDPVVGRTAGEVLYLLFTEGHTAGSGDRLLDATTTEEAIRLTRGVRRRLPDDDELGGLLALMLLTDARRVARTDDGGELVPLAEQDRTRWDAGRIAEGTALVALLLPRGPVGPWQLQAAIAAVHAEAATAAGTDWQQVVVLYRMLDRLAPGPAVTLGLAVALGETRGAAAGLAATEALLAERPDWHRVHAVRAHLLESAGRVDDAVAAYRRAAQLTTSTPEQRHLHRRAAALVDRSEGAGSGAGPS